jgi:hypothetical protein
MRKGEGRSGLTQNRRPSPVHGGRYGVAIARHPGPSIHSFSAVLSTGSRYACTVTGHCVSVDRAHWLSSLLVTRALG